MDTAPVQTGLEVLLAEGSPQLHGRRAGLIANPTAVDRRLRDAADLLHADDRIRLVALFGSEHGVRGDAQAGVEVEGALDARTGLPVHSLYGRTRRPTAAMLAGLDVLLFDLQDVGVRYATYIATMAYAQQAAAEAGVAFVVLDRPNPLGGGRVEGGRLDPAFASFVGVYDTPVRHGMTTGELARLFAAERGLPEPLIVTMRGWRRERWFDETGLPWVQPSPNLPTLDSVTLYPATCLIEGTNLSEGRGTTRPFELIGAPWLDPYALSADLEGRGLPGVGFRPAWFTPAFSKHAAARCAGIQVHVLDRNQLRSAELGIHLLHALRVADADAFAWQQAPDGAYFIDRLLGSDQPRLALDAGDAPAAVTAGWPDQCRAFQDRRQPFLLYK